MNYGKILFSIAVGIVVGVLFAPAKGSVVRKNLIRKGNKYADDVSDTFSEFSDALSEEYNTVTKVGAEFVGNLKEKAAAATKGRVGK